MTGLPAAKRAHCFVGTGSRMPDKPWRLDGIRWAPTARAVADAARIEREPQAVRALEVIVVSCAASTLAYPRQPLAALAHP